MDRIAISETLATRIGNSFPQAMKQRVLLERISNRKSYEQNRNFRNSCHKNPEFFSSKTRTLSGKQRSRSFFCKEYLIADLMKRVAISEFIRKEAEPLMTKILLSQLLLLVTLKIMDQIIRWSLIKTLLQYSSGVVT